MQADIGAMPSFEHPYDFDPTYGYTLERLLKIKEPEGAPSDFARFWRGTMQSAENQTGITSRKILPPPDPGWQLEQLQMHTLDGSAFAAWYLAPKDVTRVQRAFVAGHGYGGRESIPWPVAFDDAAYLFPCAQGFNISEQDGIPNNAAEHVVHGIGSKETYLIRYCVAALHSCAVVLEQIHPHVKGRIGYRGESFGGGLGALMLPWSDRFVRAFLKVPTFGHHPLRLSCKCVGSGESVRRAVEADPGIRETLAYYDAATAATFIKIPVMVAPALFDPAVPPPGQFAVANCLSGKKKLHVLNAEHFDHPSLQPALEELEREVKTWFQEM